MATPDDAVRFDLDSSRRIRPFDLIYAAICAAAYAGLLYVYGDAMDYYEHAILAGTAIAVGWLGWFWKPFRVYALAVGAVTVFALSRYPEIGAGQQDFFLRYLLSSQSAIMWMSALFFAATLVYFAALASRNQFTGRVASSLTWTAAAAGLIGLLVRWRESYLISADYGHIPVSNLYEVFILFALITALIYLYYEGYYRTRALGGFVMLVINAAIGFLLWYHFDRGASEIEPLVPALQSWWMKIHVPANFVGYGAFALAAMVAVAYLIKHRRPAGVVGGKLPELQLMDDVMYRAIALGFAFFTLATILGALWAAEAWGGYWSWDPKETWALIVWLNYAAWLHLRFTKGWRGVPMAWWALVGLLVTTFCFLGVNMFLSGLHSYGEL